MTINPRASLVAGNGVTIAFDDQNDWGAGFLGGVAITNTSGVALSGWTLAFNLAEDITNIWNAVIVSHVGSTYVIKNAAWNGSMAAGAVVSFGFQADGGNPVLPTSFSWNGTPVVTTVPTPVPLPTITIAGATVRETSAPTQSLRVRPESYSLIAEFSGHQPD